MKYISISGLVDRPGIEDAAVFITGFCLMLQMS